MMSPSCTVLEEGYFGGQIHLEISVNSEI